MTDTDQIIKYIRLNLSTIKSMLIRPSALKDITKKLKLEMPKGELADLIGPLVVQRAQGTIQESGLKRGIDLVLDSMPAKKEEEEFQQEQRRNKPLVDVKVGALIPYSLSGFKSDHTNQVAAELYDRYSRQFSVGQAIAMTRRDLNRTDLDLTPAPPPEREVPKMPESKPVRHPVEHPSLFSRDEIKYAAAETEIVWTRRVDAPADILNKIDGKGERYRFQAHDINMPPAWVTEFLTQAPVYVIKEKAGNGTLKPGDRVGLLGSLPISGHRMTTYTDRGVRRPHKVFGTKLLVYAVIALGIREDKLITMFPLVDDDEKTGQAKALIKKNQGVFSDNEVQNFLKQTSPNRGKTGYTKDEGEMMFTENHNGKKIVFFTKAELNTFIPKGKTASEMTDEEYHRHINAAVAKQYPGHEIGLYTQADTEDI